MGFHAASYGMRIDPSSRKIVARANVSAQVATDDPPYKKACPGDFYLSPFVFKT